MYLVDLVQDPCAAVSRVASSCLDVIIDLNDDMAGGPVLGVWVSVFGVLGVRSGVEGLLGVSQCTSRHSVHSVQSSAALVSQYTSVYLHWAVLCRCYPQPQI
jgi:hypothetical protein